MRIFLVATRIGAAVAAVLFSFLPVGAAELTCPASSVQQLDLPATRAALKARLPITIVAFGSSSTEGSGAGGLSHAYPALLEVALRAAWHDVPVTVLNRGVGGQTTEMMMARLQKDVLEAKPTLVIWQAGANEALRGMDPAMMDVPLHEGLARVLATGADVVLMDNQLSRRMPDIANRDAYGEVLVHEAARGGAVSVFSRTALMEEWMRAEGNLDTMIGPDGVHQSPRGYACLAESLGRSIVASVQETLVSDRTRVRR